MPDAESFVAAVAANPADDLPRLVFADWLDENGDPARAAFIRDHVALAKLRPGTRRVQGPLPQMRRHAEGQPAGVDQVRPATPSANRPQWKPMGRWWTADGFRFVLSVLARNFTAV